MGQHPHLGQQIDRGNLGDHEPRLDSRIPCKKRGQPRQVRIQQAFDTPLADARDIGHGDRQEVQCLCDHLRMKVARAEHDPGIREDQWVVGGAVHFDFEDLPHVAQSAAGGTVDLRHAP